MNIDDFPFNEFAEGKSEEQLVEHINSLSEISETMVGDKKYVSSAKVSNENKYKILKVYVDVGIIDESYLLGDGKWESIGYGNGTFTAKSGNVAMTSADVMTWNSSQ